MSSNAFSAADMTTAAASGHRDGYQAGYADAVKAVEVGKPAAAQEAVAWHTMATCPRDGTVILLHWGEDHVSPGWWDAAVAPVQNEDGTWPSDTCGFPWAFFDLRDGTAFVNHAADTEYGPTHWSIYAAPVAAAPIECGNCHDGKSDMDHDCPKCSGSGVLPSTPAAPGTDLAQFKDLIGFAAWSAINLPEIDPRRDFIRQASELLALIDASPKGGDVEAD